jgi:hypothetical protein
MTKSPSLLGRKALFLRWCGGGDSNSHSLAATRSLALRVYLFHHPRATTDIIISLFPIVKGFGEKKLKLSSFFDPCRSAAPLPEVI